MFSDKSDKQASRSRANANSTGDSSVKHASSSFKDNRPISQMAYTLKSVVQPQANVSGRNATIGTLNTAITNIEQEGDNTPATKKQYQYHDGALGSGQHHSQRNASSKTLVGDIQKKINGLAGHNTTDNAEILRLQGISKPKKAQTDKITQLRGLE